MWKYNGKAIRAGRGWTDSDGSEEREAKERANQEFEIREH